MYKNFEGKHKCSYVKHVAHVEHAADVELMEQMKHVKLGAVITGIKKEYHLKEAMSESFSRFKFPRQSYNPFNSLPFHLFIEINLETTKPQNCLL